eukprot:CAMPEP_0174837882 /NCGR_PEP_ID=MMETSP1114-20130205/7045_1 /TAXON_ID=312471 /ORGANISM="Neobodo designis, Strain CCAP 1951/1" /LENGTH=69 /DNA_ID=CAMNT_0016071969 /DNA_START=32 /DNA_END=238 /DNA_ORIENTATION=+
MGSGTAAPARKAGGKPAAGKKKSAGAGAPSTKPAATAAATAKPKPPAKLDPHVVIVRNAEVDLSAIHAE